MPSTALKKQLAPLLPDEGSSVVTGATYNNVMDIIGTCNVLPDGIAIPGKKTKSSAPADNYQPEEDLELPWLSPENVLFLPRHPVNPALEVKAWLVSEQLHVQGVVDDLADVIRRLTKGDQQLQDRLLWAHCKIEPAATDSYETGEISCYED